MDFDAESVLEIAARGEGREVEFKRGLPGPAKTARSLVAFANTRGGVLLIGITDRGALWGVAEARAVAAALREIARERADPPIPVHVQAVRVGEQQVVACSVPLSPDRPHHLLLDEGERELVVRVGASNRTATGATLAALQQPHRRGPANDLERRVLAWLAAKRRGEASTVARFAKESNVGTQRARRAFVELERAGRLVAHGFGARRVYELA
jgi:hypothetical protein